MTKDTFLKAYFQLGMANFTDMEKNDYLVLGIMSGTSLDGLDVALIRFRRNNTWDYDILQAATFPYSKAWEKRLAEAVLYSDAELEKLNSEYTDYLAGVIAAFIEKHQVKDLDAVCSHGHTIKHEPQNGYTLQIGNLPKLARLLGQTVVCDFRVQDVDLGGQGAPLVPIGDELLFKAYDYCLNLGGFANVSSNENGKRIAYDICAVNTVLNHLAGRIGLAYDENGTIARKGKLDTELLRHLDSLEFYAQKPPKSLGIEWVNKYIFPLLEDVETSTALQTYVVHAASKITACFDNNPASRVLVTGGGAFNGFLMNKIQAETACQIHIPSPDLVNYKEALIFGFLGILKLRDEVNVLGSVTGASRDHSSGKVFRGLR